MSKNAMKVMPGANTGFDCGVLFGSYPGRMAQLHNPIDKNGGPRYGWNYALDNGVYGAWSNGEQWNEKPLYDFLDNYHQRPLWVAVPDWVADRDQTLRLWEAHAPALMTYGVPLAFVVQDGMETSDVPQEADVVFVGGTTSWKWRNLKQWTEAFKRVHVGKVNTYKLLWEAHEAGAESCDGTGWFRGGPERLQGLKVYLEESSMQQRPQMQMDLPTPPPLRNLLGLI
ncbi:MAG: hypothetical protein CBD27_03110 [Rhodospirillaceae bacterium TMED167]|nr:MAG: hypothetical protein CBD27_03110 [Rhodospirillaceae bacterium TMED167]